MHPPGGGSIRISCIRVAIISILLQLLRRCHSPVHVCRVPVWLPVRVPVRVLGVVRQGVLRKRRCTRRFRFSEGVLL